MEQNLNGLVNIMRSAECTAKELREHLTEELWDWFDKATLLGEIEQRYGLTEWTGRWLYDEDGKFFILYVIHTGYDGEKYHDRINVYCNGRDFSLEPFERNEQARYEGHDTGDKNRSIWMRAGVSLFMNEFEYDAIMTHSDDCSDVLKNILTRGDYEFNGDSYIPDGEMLACNDRYGTNYVTGDLTIDL